MCRYCVLFTRAVSEDLQGNHNHTSALAEHITRTRWPNLKTGQRSNFHHLCRILAIYKNMLRWIPAGSPPHFLWSKKTRIRIGQKGKESGSSRQNGSESSHRHEDLYKLTWFIPINMTTMTQYLGHFNDQVSHLVSISTWSLFEFLVIWLGLALMDLRLQSIPGYFTLNLSCISWDFTWTFLKGLVTRRKTNLDLLHLLVSNDLIIKTSFSWSDASLELLE